MKKYLGNAIWVLCIFVCLEAIACGGEEDNSTADGDRVDEVEQEPVPCYDDRDCITTGSPMLCEKDGFCHRIECISLAWCQDIDSLNVLPIMVCEDGYCEKKPCDSDDECDWHYDPESIVEGPFACINGYCERPFCDSDQDCPPYRECINGFCRYCQKSAYDIRRCENNNVVEKRFSLSEGCSLILDEVVVIEECGPDKHCIEKVASPDPLEVYCESLNE